MECSDFRVLRSPRDTFLSICLAISTGASAMPLAWLFPGLLVSCTNWHFRAIFLNSADANCGPLSLTKVLGMPCRQKLFFSFLTTVSEFASDRKSNWKKPLCLPNFPSQFAKTSLILLFISTYWYFGWNQGICWLAVTMIYVAHTPQMSPHIITDVCRQVSQENQVSPSTRVYAYVSYVNIIQLHIVLHDLLQGSWYEYSFISNMTPSWIVKLVMVAEIWL